MLLDEVQPRDDLRIADDEAEPPAGHAVALREREHLDADLACAVLGEEALGPAAVEDEVGVGEVVHDRRARLVRELDRLGEDAGRSRDGGRVRGIVEVDRGDAFPRRARPVGAAVLAERERDPLGARQCDRRVVVGVAGIGQQDPLAALREHERELDERRRRPRQERDLALGVELDAVDGGVAVRDRLLRRREPREGRIAVDGGRRLARRFDQRLDHVWRRRHVGVAAADVDHVRPGRRDAREERREVLLRQALDPVGAGPHRPDATAQLRPVDDLEGRAGDAVKRVQLVVRPLRARRAAQVPVRAVVGDDHPVLLQRLEHDPRLAREAGDRIALLQAEAHSHRRQVGIGLVAREVACGPDVGAARVLDGEAQRVVDPAAGDVLVTCEAGEDREAGRVGRRPAGRPELVRAEVEDRARAGPPAAARSRGRARTARRACSCRGRRSARAGRRRTRGRPRSRRSSGSGTAPCPTRPRTRRRRATSPVPCRRP